MSSPPSLTVKKSKRNSPQQTRSVSAAERDHLGRGAAVDTLPRALGAPLVRGNLRSRPEDFVVDEQLAFSLSGSGEHLYLRIRKTDQNTRWVARELARCLDLPFRAVSFAGLKDRHAVTSQWFSIHLPGRPDPDTDALAIDGVEVLECTRHSAKLRTGALVGNRFRLVIRDLSGDVAGLNERLATLCEQPVPNYFGAQRFGHDGGNLDLLSEPGSGRDRHARSFGLSALRSAMFNLWLAQRIEDGSWCVPVSGEILSRPGETGYVHASRLLAGETAAPAGLLWGAGDNQATGEALERERAFFAGFPVTCATLEDFDARMMRRPLGMRFMDLQHELCDDRLEIGFSLARGQFATTVIRELGEFTDAN